MSAAGGGPLDEAKKRFLVLHKGLGLRRPGLCAHLGPALCDLWGISVSDPMDIVHAKAVAQIDSAITKRVTPELAEIARDYYNASAEPLMWPLNFEERLTAIHARLGNGYSVSNIRRDAKSFVPQMLAALDDVASIRTQLPPPRHADHAKPLVDTIRDLHDPDRLANRIVAIFLRTAVHWPGYPSIDCQVAHMTGLGAWLCVFTSTNRYRDYQRQSGAPWPDKPSQALGLGLLLNLHARRPDVGLLVDPCAHQHASLADTLCLPAGLIDRIIEQHNRTQRGSCP
jgi:hypothetical protein